MQSNQGRKQTIQTSSAAPIIPDDTLNGTSDSKPIVPTFRSLMTPRVRAVLLNYAILALHTISLVSLVSSKKQSGTDRLPGCSHTLVCLYPAIVGRARILGT